MRLRHADREVPEAVALELRDLRLRLRVQEDVTGTVHACRDGLDLVADRRLVRVELPEGAWLLACLDDSAGQARRADASLLEALVDLGSERAGLERELAHALDLLIAVSGASVHGDHARHPELGHDGEMPADVRHAHLDGLQPLSAIR